MKTTNQRRIAAAALIICLTNLQFAQAADLLDMPNEDQAVHEVAPTRVRARKVQKRLVNQASPATAAAIAAAMDQDDELAQQAQADEAAQSAAAQSEAPQIKTRVKKASVAKKQNPRITPTLYYVPSQGSEVSFETSYLKTTQTVKSSSSSSGYAKDISGQRDTDLVETRLAYSFSRMFAIGVGAGYRQDVSSQDVTQKSFTSNTGSYKIQSSDKGTSDPRIFGNLVFDTSSITIATSLEARTSTSKAETKETRTSTSSNSYSLEGNGSSGGSTIGLSLLAYTNNTTSALFGGRFEYVSQMERSRDYIVNSGSALPTKATQKISGGNMINSSAFVESLGSDWIRFGGVLGYSKQDDSKVSSSATTTLGSSTIKGIESMSIDGYVNLMLGRGFEIVPSIGYVEVTNKNALVSNGDSVDSVSTMHGGLLGRISF